MDYKDIDLETHKKNKKFFSPHVATYTKNGYAYSEHPCPACDAQNWLYQGDTEDLTQPDRDGIECAKCGHKFYAMDSEFIPEFMHAEFEQYNGDLEKMIQEDVGFFEKGELKPPYE